MGVSNIEGVEGEFDLAINELWSGNVRDEVVLTEMAAPKRVATHAHATSGDVVVDGDEIGTGRFVLLHEPEGNQSWGGTWRCVVFARADIEHEMAIDPALSSVAWSWLTEALDAAGAGYDHIAGTTTIVRSESFGQMADDETSPQLEIRASWTPRSALGAHLETWSETLCTVAGLPQLIPGVASIDRKRLRR